MNFKTRNERFIFLLHRINFSIFILAPVFSISNYTILLLFGQLSSPISPENRSSTVYTVHFEEKLCSPKYKAVQNKLLFSYITSYYPANYICIAWPNLRVIMMKHRLRPTSSSWLLFSNILRVIMCCVAQYTRDFLCNS
jgi:hypothetical protein